MCNLIEYSVQHQGKNMHIQITSTIFEFASSLKNLMQDKGWQKLLREGIILIRNSIQNTTKWGFFWSVDTVPLFICFNTPSTQYFMGYKYKYTMYIILQECCSLVANKENQWKFWSHKGYWNTSWEPWHHHPTFALWPWSSREAPSGNIGESFS